MVRPLQQNKELDYIIRVYKITFYDQSLEQNQTKQTYIKNDKQFKHQENCKIWLEKIG